MFRFRLGGGNIKYSLTTGPPVNKCCEFCNNSRHMGGPIWINNLHHTVFIQSLLDSLTEERFSTFPRMTGMISMALEELEDVPLYYELARLCNITKLSQGKMTLYLSAILNAGYRVSLTHANKVNFSAPLSVSHAFFFVRLTLLIIPARDQDRRTDQFHLEHDEGLVQAHREGEA